MVQSFESLSSTQLSKINAYLDEVEYELNQFHSAKETNEIIYILRQQLFQQIELHDAARKEFDIDRIIRQNRDQNKALISGNDRDEVIFTIGKPKWSVEKRTKEIQSEHVDRKTTARSDTNQILRQNDTPLTITEKEILNSELRSHNFLLPFSIIFMLLASIPTVEAGIAASFLFVGLLSFSVLFVTYPVRTWVLAQLIQIFGVVISATFLVGVHDESLLSLYVSILIPLFALHTSYKLLKNKIGISNLEEKSNISKILYLGIFSFMIWSSVFAAIIAGYELSYNFIGYFNFLGLSYLFLIGLSVYYLNSEMEILSNWDQELFSKINEKSLSNHIESKGITTGKEDTTHSDELVNSVNTGQGSEVTSPKTRSISRSSDGSHSANQRQLVQLLGLGAGTGKVRLGINMEQAKNRISFRFFSIFRILSFVLILFAFGTAIFFKSIGNVYTLYYYIDLIGYDQEDFMNNPWEFKNEAVILSMLVGFSILVFNTFIVLLHAMGSLFTRYQKKVIRHLALKQGIVSVEALSVAPPGVDEMKYYDFLGELVMDGVISIEHIPDKEVST